MERTYSYLGVLSFDNRKQKSRYKYNVIGMSEKSLRFESVPIILFCFLVGCDHLDEMTKRTYVTSLGSHVVNERFSFDRLNNYALPSYSR